MSACPSRLQPDSGQRVEIDFTREEVRHSFIATFRQNVGDLACVPALWRGAATNHSGPREASLPATGGCPRGSLACAIR